ncbi:MAG: hypothetical protein ACRD2T_15375, partial [Thermoanaerobaculia bacterium]
PEVATWARRADAWADEDTLTYEVPSSGAYQGFALFLLGLALAALALVFTHIGELTRWRYLGAARAAAVLILLSILCGAAQLVLTYLDLRPLQRWRGLLFLAQALLAAAAGLPMAMAFLFD